ncbi:MAG: biotin transporter BioY [Actinobacteria bacterium]|nr:biotin transporter BioY [Actinomycetota bacterium]MCG2807806.1 biotin transporter BioY [Coriobacteriia bacterium]
MNQSAVVSRPRGVTRSRVTSALVAALLAASAFVTIPIGTVPLTLQVFVVVLAALLLEPFAAAAAVGMYLILGAIGLPVFSGMKGGFGVLMGPTGGYLVGFLVGAVVASIIRTRLASRGVPLADALAAAACILVIYVIGWFQLHVVTGLGWGAAFAAGVAPFVLIDIAKAVVAIGVAGALRRAGVIEAT